MRKLFIGVACVGVMIAAAMQSLHAQSAPDRTPTSRPTNIKPSPNPQTAKQRPARPKAKAPVDVAKRPSTQPASLATVPPRTAQPQVTAKELPPQPTLGRIPFENGSLGLSTTKQYSTTIFSDGRVTPGFENVQTKDPTYFGFSLSVPTHKNSIFPLPLLSRPD